MYSNKFHIFMLKNYRKQFCFEIICKVAVFVDSGQYHTPNQFFIQKKDKFVLIESLSVKAPRICTSIQIFVGYNYI